MTAATARPDGVGPREILDRTRAWFQAHQSLRIIFVGLVVALLLPLAGGALEKIAPGFGTQRDWVGGFSDAGVFILLAWA